MAPGPTFVAALVGGLRRHGTRPAVDGGPSWSAVADDARCLALGLREAGWGDGTRIRVRGGETDLAGLVGREVGVLAAGAVLVVDEAAGHDVDLTGARALGAGRERLVADLCDAGMAAAAARPDAHEVHLSTLDADLPAVAAADLVATHAQMAWALRSVAAWLGGPLPGGPDRVVAPGVPPEGEAVAAALVGRWWPAAAGAALVDGAAGPDLLDAVRRVRPDLVVLDPDGWRALADAVRAEADRSRPAVAALRSGRVDAAGEERSRSARAAGRLARGWSWERLVARAGLDHLGAGVCLGPLGLVDGRDLAAIGLPVASAWIDPSVPAPIAATSLLRPGPERWGRPLPGRSVEVGAEVVVRGGDVAGGGAIARARTRVDSRGRVEVSAGAR